jgi:lipopolysaccharide/colanic/teichoic acid biosynthesis glycosyltransferase
MIRNQRSTSVSLGSYRNSGESGNSWNDRDINYCNDNCGYKIKIKDEKLLVKRTYKASQMHLLSNRSEEFLAEWLQFSPATIVQIDSRIELDKLQMWANQCKKYKKAVFLRLSQEGKLVRQSNNYNNLNRLIKRCCDFLAALILLIIFFPVFIALALFIGLYFKEPILQTQWCVGKDRKLFSIYKFGGNLQKINLDILNKLPQLFNIVKGDMSFVGRFPISLSEAIKISPSEQHYLHVLPGITASIRNKK